MNKNLPHEKTLRCAVWAAVSSEAQAEDDKVSIAVQLRQGRDVAAKHNANVVAELVVPGRSRSIILFEDAARRIPAYSELHKLLTERAIDVLVYLDSSRLGRTAALVMTIEALCRDAGVQMYELANPPRDFGRSEYSTGTALVGAWGAIGAEDEIHKLRYRHKIGMMGRVQAGKIPTGTPAWGYTKRFAADGSEIIEVDESIALWVRKVFEWYVAGASGMTIADRLNQAGIRRTKGGGWTSPKVYVLLARVWRYAGYSEINRTGNRQYTKARGNWQAIISEELAERVVAERAVREHDRSLADTPYVLAGVVVCAQCGKKMYARTIKRSPPRTGEQVQLFCPSPHKRKYVSYPRALQALRDAILSLSTLDLSDIPDDDLSPAIIRELQAHTHTLTSQLDARTRANNAYVMGLMDLDTYAEQVKRLDDYMAATRSKIDELRLRLETEEERGGRASRIEEVIEDGLAVIEDGGPEANAWLRNHVQMVAKDNRIVDIIFL
jgi:DNA invertase Pin-like site-specific DNA recombinase